MAEQYVDNHTVDCEIDGHGENNSTAKCMNETTSDNVTIEDEEEIEKKYERLRDDQMNTGVIAALLGGFALSNSWEMEIHEMDDPTDKSNIYVVAYVLAICAVHCCTCSALVSAFLYRALTQQTSSHRGVQWMEKHSVLRHLPWTKFMIGVLCYLVSVALVAWTTLEFNSVAQYLTLLLAICGCAIAMYTVYIISTDNLPADIGKNSLSTGPKHRT